MPSTTPRRGTDESTLTWEQSPVFDEGVPPAVSADPAQTAVDLATMLVEHWADHAAVHLLDSLPVDPAHVSTRRPVTRSVLRRVAAVHRPGAARPGTLLPTDRVLHPPADGSALSSLAKGETVYVPCADYLTASGLATQLGEPRQATALRNCSILLVPLNAGRKLLGHVMLVREPGRPAFGDDVVTATQAVARWAALCMESGRAYDRAARLADDLRSGFWPDPPPRLADLQICFRYLPESRSSRIGGDWFDVIRLTGDRVALVIGDVMGHGLNAAIVMNRCKTIVRTLVLLGMPPDEALLRFDELARQHDDDHIATCLIVIYDRATHQCHAANAGQIPPVLVHPDRRSEVVDLPTGTPAGVGGPAFEARSFTAAPGSLLALCTDGLTALHHAHVDLALSRLCSTLSGPARPLDDICDDVFRDLPARNRRDDATLLLTRFLAGPPSPRPSG